uniref:Uncharacterized protein n=1 Tax=Magallana gigas TaxID=29159 RepID=A0A8W8MI83_MAGGI
MKKRFLFLIINIVVDIYFCDERPDEVCSDIHCDIIHEYEYCCHDNKQPCPSEWCVGWFGCCCVLLPLILAFHWLSEDARRRSFCGDRRMGSTDVFKKIYFVSPQFGQN